MTDEISERRKIIEEVKTTLFGNHLLARDLNYSNLDEALNLLAEKIEKSKEEENYKKGWDDGINEGKSNFDDLYNSAVEEKERLEQQLKEKENFKISEYKIGFADATFKQIEITKQQLSNQKKEFLEMIDKLYIKREDSDFRTGWNECLEAIKQKLEKEK